MSVEEQEKTARSKLRPLSFAGTPTKGISPSPSITSLHSFPTEKWKTTDVNNSPGKLQITPEMVHQHSYVDSDL